MGVGQLSESDAVDALRLPFYSSSHPTGSHGWRNQFDLGNPDLDTCPMSGYPRLCSENPITGCHPSSALGGLLRMTHLRHVRVSPHFTQG